MSGGYYVIGDMKGNGEGFRSIFSWLMHHSGETDPKVFYVDAGGNQYRSYPDDFRKAIKHINRFAQVNTQKITTDMSVMELSGLEYKLERGFLHSDIIFFEAGSIETLRQNFIRYNLAELAKNAWEKGALVGGLCGGGSILAEQVVYHEQNFTSSAKGLGLIEGVAVSCKMHKADHEARLTLLAQTLKQDFARYAVGLSVDQAVLFEANSISAIPTGRDKDGQPFLVTDSSERQSIAFAP